MEIKKVKEQNINTVELTWDDDTFCTVPKIDGNKEYELIKEWLSEGNTPEPGVTEAELAQQVIDKKIAEAKAYLASTDFKMTVDYYAILTAEQQEKLTTLRAKARLIINELEG